MIYTNTEDSTQTCTPTGMFIPNSAIEGIICAYMYPLLKIVENIQVVHTLTNIICKHIPSQLEHLCLALTRSVVVSNNLYKIILVVHTVQNHVQNMVKKARTMLAC